MLYCQEVWIKYTKNVQILLYIYIKFFIIIIVKSLLCMLYYQIGMIQMSVGPADLPSVY